MAYSATITVIRIDEKNWRVKIDEIDAEATSEATILPTANSGADQVSQLPRIGTVTRQSCYRISGTGTTVRPILGTATNPSADTIIVQVASASDSTDVQGQATYYKATSSGSFYHRSNINSGTNNVITTIYHIKEGW